MKTPEYGTAEHYYEMFSDILADCGTGLPDEDQKTIHNVMLGFERAIISWLEYHESAANNYRELHQRFIAGYLQEPTNLK